MQAMEEIVHAAQALDKRPDVKALIITGEGPKYFAAGADIKEMADQTYDEVRLLDTVFPAIPFIHQGERATLHQHCTAEINALRL